MIDVTPAIFIQPHFSQSGAGFTDDFEVLKSQVATLVPYTPWIQIDFSDGTMVPNKTFFDLDKFVELFSQVPSVSFEAHLIVDNPVKYLKPLADSGFKRIIAQVEASDPRQFLEEAKLEMVEVGLALDGASEVDILEPFMEEIDLLVIMTIEAGSADSPFLPESIEKIKNIRHHFPDLSSPSSQKLELGLAIAAEGNIDMRNAKLLTEAGVTRLVVSSDILLKDPGILSQTLESLQGNQ